MFHKLLQVKQDKMHAWNIHPINNGYGEIITKFCGGLDTTQKEKNPDGNLDSFVA